MQARGAACRGCGEVVLYIFVEASSGLYLGYVICLDGFGKYYYFYVLDLDSPHFLISLGLSVFAESHWRHCGIRHTVLYLGEFWQRVVLVL